MSVSDWRAESKKSEKRKRCGDFFHACKELFPAVSYIIRISLKETGLCL